LRKESREFAACEIERDGSAEDEARRSRGKTILRY
jgi:hypothetical protein